MCKDSEFNLEERILCSNGACIGLVGPDGICKECGKPYDGPLPSNDNAPSDEDVQTNGSVLENNTEREADAPPSPLDSGAVLQPDEETDADFDLASRMMCEDDTCIGVVGPDGRCGTCGKQHDIS